MAKFSIACPECGRFAEASTGFFARKKIDCACGYTINVKTDKMTSRKCTHCGNQVIFDQSKGSDAKCPVCHENINMISDNQKTEIFSCAQCGIRLETTRGAEKYTCPVCDFENDIQERLMSEKIKTDGLASIIKYEGENNIFIWKHPIEDFNYGSQLIVHESQEAIFFRDGQALDLFGPGRYTLETQQLPLLENAYSLPTDTQGTFHSEVYFINKTVQMSIKWGTPDKVRFIDPLTGVPLELGASGEMNLQVQNARKLLVKLVGTTNGIAWGEGDSLTKSIQASFRPLIVNAVKTNLPAVIKSEAIDLLEIDEKLDLISANLREKIVAGFEEYGLTIPQFYVNNIVLPEDDPNFKRIRELHSITLQTRMFQAEATIKAAQAQSDAQAKIAQAQSEAMFKTAQAQSEEQYRIAQEQSKAAIEAAHRQAEIERQATETEIARHEAERRVIDAQAEAQARRVTGVTEAELLKMTGLTEAEIMQAKGYSQRDVLQAEVQKSYAESIGNMGPVISGGSGGGSGIIGEMMELGVGMAAASAIAPQLGEMLNGIRVPAGANVGNTANGQMLMAGMMQANGQANMAGMVQPNMAGGMNVSADAWDCSCGNKGIVGNFCNICGNRKPQPVADTWDCSCGNKGIIGNFCSNCGSRKPQPVADTWDCSCGNKGITGNFCNNCGAKRPDNVPQVAATWDCSCGKTGITGNFCDNCGAKKPE